MFVPNNKNISAEIALHISSASRYLHMGKFFVVFVGSHSRIYCSELASPLLYTPKYFFWVRVYIDVFSLLNISYSLTATRTLIFGYIKWTLDVAFTGIFLDIVCGQYFRQEMGKTLPPQMRNESVITSFCLERLPRVLCPFREKWETGVWNQGIFRILLCVLSTSYIEIILEATMPRVYLPICRCDFC